MAESARLHLARRARRSVDEPDDDRSRVARAPEGMADPDLARLGDRAATLALQATAGNAATATLVQGATGEGAATAVVQREGRGRQTGGGPADDLDAALAGIDDDSANIAAILAEADQAEARSAYERGVAAFRAQRFVEAGRLFEESATIYPAARSELLFNAARAYQEAASRGRPRPAPGPDAEEAARSGFRAGVDAFTSGDFAAAITEFRRAMAAVPAPELEWNLAMAYYRAGRPADARDHFQAYAITSGSSNAATWIRRCEREAQGSGDISERDLDILGESEQESNEAIVAEAAQSDARGDYEAGVSLFREGSFSGAAGRFASAAAAMPDTPELAYNAALASQRAGDNEAAIAGFKRYLGIGE